MKFLSLTYTLQCCRLRQATLYSTPNSSSLGSEDSRNDGLEAFIMATMEVQLVVSSLPSVITYLWRDSCQTAQIIMQYISLPIFYYTTQVPNLYYSHPKLTPTLAHKLHPPASREIHAKLMRCRPRQAGLTITFSDVSLQIT